MFRSFVCAITACVAFVAGPVCAEEKSPSREQMRRAFLDRFDADGDGRLSREERAKAKEFLKEIRGEEHEPIPQTVFPGKTDLYKLADGEAEIEVIETFHLAGKDGGRTIPLRITLPVGEEPAPLVVLCHGALGSKDGLQALASYWGSHGYIVLQPTFGDSLSLMTAEERLAFDSLLELVNSPRTTKHWDDRPHEVSHILDSIELLQREIKPLSGRIDADRIAVAGHSFGAHTTMLLAGLTLRSGEKELNFRDERIKASIMISPQGPDKAITPASYKTLAGPLLMITGDNDGTPIKGREDKAGAWRRKAFDYCQADDAYLLWIDGAYHSFGGIGGEGRFSGAGPMAPDHIYYVKSTGLAFLDATLGDDADAKAYLQGEQLRRETKGKAKIERKE